MKRVNVESISRELLFILIFLLFFAVTLQNCLRKREPNVSQGFAGRTGTPAHLKEITEQIDDSRLIHADRYSGDWLTHGLNYSEDRFSPLDQISKSNVDSLGLAWSLILGTKRGIETTPLVVGWHPVFIRTLEYCLRSRCPNR